MSQTNKTPPRDNDKLLAEELKMLQDIIKRMADNSFKLKGWTVSIIIIAMIFRAKIDNLLLCFVPLVAFGILDAYYLMLERKFRELYNSKVELFHNLKIEIFHSDAIKEAIKEKYKFKQMFQFKIEKTKWDIAKAIFSYSILGFYVGIGVLIFLIWKYEKGGNFCPFS